MKRMLIQILAATSAIAAEDFAFFESRIRPVLIEKCYSCHSAEAEKVKGGLLLDTREGIRRGGDTAPAVVPGDVKGSLLVRAIHYEDDLEMPPKERLSPEIVADFEKWIATGAADPRDGTSKVAASTIDIEEGRKHWAFQPIAKPAVPSVKDASWPKTDIDRFILAELEAKGLRPVADATAQEMRRRIAFDLTGLPPDAASSTDIPAQIEKLLDSPRFGERWGRHWLDVARYAESSGSGHNVLFPLAFRYRDWVIDSFNADKPYDQFVREQLAGDLLPAENDAQRDEQLIGTGFLTVGIKDLRENGSHRFRMAMADEQIDATSRAFMGLTLACAKCHDHKFDPIPTRDYYALAGIFTSSEPMLGARRNRQRDPFAAGLLPLSQSPVVFSDKDLATMLRERVDLTYARLKVRDEKWRILTKKKLPVKNVKPEVEEMLMRDPAVKALADKADEQERRYEELRERYDAAMPHTVMGLRDVKPADCAVHIRGEDTQLGEVVPRGFPQVLVTATTKPVNPEQSGRLELAEWIASPQNPLTARVMVNRIWQHLFGAGIVESPDDFGKTGQPPSNPALLDHLAGRFIAHGWSVKKMIAEIMQSHVYQLGMAHDDKSIEVDPANRLQWRMNRRRLDSDAIMDAVRSISGELAMERPVPVIPATENDDRVKSMDLKAWFAPTRHHRTIYQPILRDYVPDEWSLFDFPDPELVTGHRGITTVPTQALFLMNSLFIVEQSAKTARRLEALSSERAEIVRHAHDLILNRKASDEELRDGVEFLQNFSSSSSEAADAVAALCQTLFASAEFRYLY